MAGPFRTSARAIPNQRRLLPPREANRFLSPRLLLRPALRRLLRRRPTGLPLPHLVARWCFRQRATTVHPNPARRWLRHRPRNRTTEIPMTHRMKRRHFLANLLFAGGAITLAGLQSAEAAEGPTDGWTLPDLSQNDPKPSPTPPPEPPQPPRPPQPPTAGVPVPAGGLKPPPPPPRPKGNVAPPQEGDPAPPKPKSK